MKRLPRHKIAGLLIVIFMAITLSPLAAFSMRSAVVMHAITGKCTGDCVTCGCSPGRSASHTCCCWFNKIEHPKNQDSEDSDCCKKKKSHRTASIAGVCPCGSSNHLDACGTEELQLLPFHFAGGLPVHYEDIIPHDVLNRLSGRNDKPPGPPPERSILS